MFKRASAADVSCQSLWEIGIEQVAEVHHQAILYDGCDSRTDRQTAGGTYDDVNKACDEDKLKSYTAARLFEQENLTTALSMSFFVFQRRIFYFIFMYLL